MKKYYLVVVHLLTVIFTNAQSNFKTFPGTGFGIVLPDSNYTERDGGFFHRKSKVHFSIMNQEADLSNIKFGEFMKMMMQDIMREGITILSNEIVSPDSSRIIKVIIDYDITDAKPATKGRKDVSWFYFYNYHQKPILLMAGYPLEFDALLSESILKSIKTLKNVDKVVTGKLFRTNFSITEDYAPLKYCGPSLGGIRLNMYGKYNFTGGDSSYCLVVPSTIAFPQSKPDSIRTYMLNRLQIHVDNDVKVQWWGMSNNGTFVLYEMTGSTYDNRLLYLAIKSDNNGYFEIWGISYKQNKQLIEVFKKIALSLQRN